MINPKIMCKNHLLGEHFEIHKIVGHLNRKKSITGFIKKNCISPKNIKKRHLKIIKEMYQRKYNHKSPLLPFDYSYLPPNEQNYQINQEQSLHDLLNRCEKCKERYENESS